MEVLAQWNTNSSVNLTISDLSIGDMQSVSTSDGKLWVAYYHENGGGYDMRAQLFDRNGNKLLGNNGILVSNKPTGTATFVFNVCTDSDNNLIVACQDERSGSMKAYVYKLNQSGTHIWSNNGIELGLGLAPYPATLSNGEVVVVWSEEVSNTLNLHKITSSGSLAWASPKTILVGTSKTTRGQVVANLNSKFTIVYQKNSGGISTQLYAQLFNNSGTALYAPLQICDQTTAPYRYYSIEAEGDTTYCGYYSSLGNRFNSFLQRINPDGTIPWGMNGSAFNTSTGASDNYQTTTNIALTPGSPFVWSVCTFTNPNQSMSGIYVQKYKKSSGSRQFTDQGKSIYPINSQSNTQAGHLQLAGDIPLFLSYDKDYKIYVTKLDANGNFVWPYSRTEISSTTAGPGSPKGRYDFNSVGLNRFAGIWTENRGSSELGYIQGISQNGLFAIDIATQGNVPPTINIGNGTLQLTSTIYPSYANQAVNWEIIPVSGSATISTNGLVTASADGTVWAKGLAVQDASVSDSLLITISGQIPVLAEVVTLPADSIGWYHGKLLGTVDANYYASNVSFEWGLTNAYGNTVIASPGLVSGNSPVGVFAVLNNLTHSTTYHYRCVASNAAGTAYGQDLTFTTDCLLSGNIGNITGETSVCASTNGITYTVPAFVGATGYEWAVPQGVEIVSGNNTNTITVNFTSSAQSGNFIVTATNGICYSTSSLPLAVQVNYVPLSPGNINGISVICDGSQNVNYMVNPVIGASSYNWTVPTGATIISGNNTNSIYVSFDPGTLSGNIYVSATNDCGTGPVSPSLFVNIEPLPGTPLSITGPEQLCNSGEEITYSIPAVSNAYTYNWTIPANAIVVSGANTNQIVLKFQSAGSGNLSVLGVNGNCYGPSSPVKSITVFSIPPKPTITTILDTLVSSADEGNQWYLEGQLIPGATQKKHLADLIGNYTVVVTLNNCSSEPSEPMFMSPVSIGDSEKSEFLNIYPNPNNGNFTLKLPFEVLEGTTLRIYTLTGKLVEEVLLPRNSLNNEIHISTKLNSGAYWLLINAENERIVSKLLIK